MNVSNAIVYILDHDLATRVQIGIWLMSAGIRARIYGSVDEFRADFRPGAAGCVVLGDVPFADVGAGVQKTGPFPDVGFPIVPIVEVGPRSEVSGVLGRRAFGVLDKLLDRECLLRIVSLAIEEARCPHTMQAQCSNGHHGLGK